MRELGCFRVSREPMYIYQKLNLLNPSMKANYKRSLYLFIVIKSYIAAFVHRVTSRSKRRKAGGIRGGWCWWLLPFGKQRNWSREREAIFLQHHKRSGEKTVLCHVICIILYVLCSPSGEVAIGDLGIIVPSMAVYFYHL